MRNLSLVLGLIVASFTSQAFGQAGSNPQIEIAVVDVGFILKNHPTMKSDLEKIETQMKQADEEMTRRRDEILKLMEQLRERLQEGTPEYEAEEKRIAEMDTEFRLEIVKRRKEFDKARAQVLYQIYSEIKNVLAYATKNFGTKVVLRVNGTREDLDPGKPETVQLLMSQEVIHFAQRQDLTQWVLDALNAQRTAQRGSTAPRQ